MSTETSTLRAADAREGPSAEETNLTDRQLLLWLDQEAARQAPSNNMVATFRIRAEVDPARLRAAFRSVVAESDALRTVFETVDGTPRSRVRPDVDRDLEHVDLSSAPDPERAFQLWEDARRQRAFRLDVCAYDSALVRLGSGDSVWYLCLHHMITDAWSFALVYERTLRAYLGQPSPPLPAFAERLDHAARHRSSAEHRRSEELWRDRLSAPLPKVLFYGSDPVRRGPYFDRREVVLDETRTAGLIAATRRLTPGGPQAASARDAALASTFMSLVLAYVHRVSGNRAIGIGCPFVNRSGKRERATIGPFMEVCPLRVELAEAETFRGLIERTRRELVAVLPHARHAVPNPTSHRAFEVMVNFHTARFEPLLGPTRTSLSTGVVGLHPASPRVASGASAEGESLVVTVHDFEGSGRLTLTLDLREDVFDEKTRARAPGHFLRLLDAFIADPEDAIERVALVDNEEQSHLLGLHGRFDTDEVHPTVVELFEAQVQKAPHRIAVRHAGVELEYGQLGERVRSLAGRLRRAGLAAEDRVAIRFHRSIDMLVAILATLKAGGAYVPLDPTHPEARVAQILEDARPTVLLTSTALRSTLDSPGLRVVCIDDGAELIEDGAEANPIPTHDQVGYLVFTSGSTGRAKGVEITHGALASHFRSMLEAPGLRAGEHMIALTTVTFDIAALELLMPLTIGSMVEIVDRATAMDGAALSALLEASPACVAFATPGTWRMLVESGWRGSPRMRVMVGGEVLPLDLADALSLRVGELWNIYGPTETTICSTIHRVPPPSERPGLAAIPIGRPIGNTSLYVLDEGQKLLPLGVTGELYIGGENVARGYQSRPDLTAERFLPDPFSPRASARMYRTGDLVSFSMDGVLRYHGRADRQVKLRGFRIEPAEVEGALLSHPSVRDAVVMVRQVAGDSRLVAYVVSHVAVPANELRAQVAARLPEYMVPAYFVSLPVLPRTSSGKTDQLALPEPSHATFAGDADGAKSEPPANDRELQLAAIWQELLGAPHVGRNDDFFALGGHSLLAVRVANRIRREFGAALSIRALFEHPTLAGLSRAIGENAGVGPALVPLAREGSAEPVFFICGIQLYQQLAVRLGEDQPSFAVFVSEEEKVVAAQSAEGATPELSIPELAKEYLDLIRRRQPHGPYRLAGSSFGGILAFEIAQVLHGHGEKVQLLAILDSILPRGITRSPLRSALARVRSVVLGKKRHERLDRGFEGDEARALNDRRHELYAAAVAAYDTQIRTYPGSMLLFRALDRSVTHKAAEVDPWCGWRDVIEGDIEVIDVPGEHLDLLRSPSVDVVAAAIRERLNR